MLFISSKLSTELRSRGSRTENQTFHTRKNNYASYARYSGRPPARLYRNLLFPWKRKLREGAYAPSHGNSLNSCKKHHYRLSIQAFSIFGILTTQLNCCEAGVKKIFLNLCISLRTPSPRSADTRTLAFFCLGWQAPQVPGVGDS